MGQEPAWQVQDAKQRLSELLRKAAAEGPQFVTRHGEEVAVVLDISYYRQLTGVEFELDFKAALSGARQDEDELADALDEIVAQRRADLPREVEMGVDG
ncbi:MAG: prevent-host-death family protein [Amycolatopsis sp.]|jgi:prevent-host-death family protein|uniref:type II toxin-antitoxin system Phd/YefM family antitoxin n=1 Tax=Amycolatopsis sp. TaxID=37632 RepID=UPI00262C0383|nr:type II toxin-antitoxin system Phd/YefM family antitoxin [Amycolatopsis sp.]MCU1685517.1 prevent-host-death family protein [Amycolatopsis sp.]